VAEYFRDQGLDVMLLFDSVTRFARAQREIGLASGEPPATRGYTPSMFDSMPKLLERSGTSDKGSITGFYTILVDGDDMDEHVADTVRGINDGHNVLSRRLAQAYHYPAIDILQSVSRLAPSISGPTVAEASSVIRRSMAAYSGAEELINVGAYKAGSNPAIDEAVARHGPINNFLIQKVTDRSTLEKTFQMMGEISGVSISPSEINLAKDANKNYNGPNENAKNISEKKAGPANVKDGKERANAASLLANRIFSGSSDGPDSGFDV
jgi:flagellum-specific ATP synthase